MTSFLIETDVPNLFQQLRRYIYLIAEDYKNKNPDIYRLLDNQYKALPPEIPQRNWHTVFAGNSIKIMPISNQLTEVDIRPGINSNKDVYEELIKHIKDHPLFKLEESQEIMDSGQDLTKKDQIPLKGISQEIPERKNIYDRLAIKWVKRSYIPRYNMSEFLSENSPIPSLTMSQFKRHLIDSHKRGIIDQDPKTKRYKPKTSS